ncbi:hypothetical protein [Methylomonas sp. DH-1]|uniref:hypothetical protein n=1 Tax=Methylomonas sp. (strain DH-1) TaxID=1727196 RepID=UPI0007C94CBC|nr:hypothetical protein [Methylomonas sp. DH-1]ANE55556.1 hypothetical protein AYM39_10445 [Methylomonas sp. DH-1]
MKAFFEGEIRQADGRAGTKPTAFEAWQNLTELPLNSSLLQLGRWSSWVCTVLTIIYPHHWSAEYPNWYPL